MKKVLIYVFYTVFLSSMIFAQEKQSQTELLRNNALKVFLDCHFCDMDYIKREIPFINYVRDRKEAQVHVMITSRETGSGGYEYKIDFIGLKDFEGDNETVIYNSGPNDTKDEIRAGRTHNMKMGLIKYVIRTPLNNFITINYDLAMEEEEKIVEDKWKSWVFEIDVQGDFQGEESYKGLSFKISGGYSVMNDQLSIPKRDATQEEILLRIREMKSQYNYECEIGLTYTFGSIYNNVVNPRFGK